MFLKFFKNLSAKRIVKKKTLNVTTNISPNRIQTVGVLIDETYFEHKHDFIKLLVEYGFLPENISVLAYKKAYKKKEEIDYPHFSKKDVSWMGNIDKEDVVYFKAQPFDLLINYYDLKKTPLVIVTHGSKANFKVGFTSVDKRLNHFMIDTKVENYQLFTEELFKYLKILNKI